MKKIRTIVVEDENRIRRGIERLVLSCGADWEVVGSFSNGQEVLHFYQSTGLEFDLLITDVRMPVMDGLTLIKELKKLTSFESMVISGFEDFSYLQTALREGATDYLIKPIDRDEYRERLEAIKRKIEQNDANRVHIKEIGENAWKLVHSEQLQQLSNIMWRAEIDLSMLDWFRDFPNGEYVLSSIKIDHLLTKKRLFETGEWNTWAFAVENILNESIEQFLKGKKVEHWIWKGDDSSYWFLMQSDLIHSVSGLLAMNLECMKEVRNNIVQYTPITLSIAVSQNFGDLSLLPSKRGELLDAIQFRLIYGGNHIYQFPLIPTVISENETKELEFSINKCIKSLNGFHFEQARTQLITFFEEFKKIDSPKIINKVIGHLTIQTTHLLITKGYNFQRDRLLNDLLNLPKVATDFKELEIEVTNWMNEVIGILEAIHHNQNGQKNYIELAKKWIAKNFDQNITIEKISRQIYMNPTYFSECFKSQTGETVLDYVTRIRIEKAEELLVTTNYKIYDISNMVGYTDTKYFSKLFKKYYGEVPSKYKTSNFHG